MTAPRLDRDTVLAALRPEDVLAFYRTMQGRGVECVFGTRWSGGGSAPEHPHVFANRLANHLIAAVFSTTYDDITNGFKMYRREVLERIDGYSPLSSQHFDLTVELPLKALAVGASYAVVPHQWVNRRGGDSKLNALTQWPRYMRAVLKAWAL